MISEHFGKLRKKKREKTKEKKMADETSLKKSLLPASMKKEFSVGEKIKSLIRS